MTFARENAAWNSPKPVERGWLIWTILPPRARIASNSSPGVIDWPSIAPRAQSIAPWFADVSSGVSGQVMKWPYANGVTSMPGTTRSS